MVHILRLTFWLAVALAFIMACLSQPPLFPALPSDRWQHALAFSCLGVLGSAAYPRLSIAKLGLGLCAFGALIEIVQLASILNRDADILDWAVDVVSIAAALGWVHLSRCIRSRPLNS